MPATMLWPISVRLGHAGRAIAQMIAISTTTIAMRIARNVSGSALRMTYLVAMKPVLQSRTKIAGAAAAADAAKLQSLFAETEAFWAPLNTFDAVNFAKRVQEGAGVIGAAAKSNDMKAALTSYAATQKNCGNCHLAHREDTGKGGFLIRP